MLNTIFQKADAKNQIIDKYCMPKKKNITKIKCSRNLNMIYQVYQQKEKVIKYKKTKEKK